MSATYEHTLESVTEPTDSESPDAQHNPDIWELRQRIDWLLSLIAGADLANADDVDAAYAEGWSDAIANLRVSGLGGSE